MTLLGMVTPPPAGAAVRATTESTTGKIGLFCPCWGGLPKTDQEWADAARNLSVIVGGGAMGKKVGYLHQQNPNLLVLVYTLGPYLSAGSPDYTAAPEEWFAHDANGKRINVPMFPRNTLMEQSNPGWRAKQAQIVSAAIAKSGFDGAMVDSMGSAPVGGGYTSAKPVNPATGVAYTAAEWLQQSVGAINAVKAAIGDKYLMFNGLISGRMYASDTNILATSNADGGLAEGFVRSARSSLSAYPSEKTWLSEVSIVSDMEAHGKNFFAWTKAWASGTDEEKSAWNTFALATYLMGKNASTSVSSGSYYAFLPDNGIVRSTVFYANEQAAIGSPVGDMVGPVDGVYTRAFSNGTVTVNPTARTASITVIA
jgi:hypothetical protein